MDTLRLFLFFAVVNTAAAYGGAALAQGIGLWPMLALCLTLFLVGRSTLLLRDRSHSCAAERREVVRCA
jgi:hypothetical protein